MDRGAVDNQVLAKKRPIGPVYGLESPALFLSEAKGLFSAHAHELESSLGVGLDLDMGGYERLYRHGQLLLLTARDQGVMVGYLVISLLPHDRNKGVLVAREEGLYVVPEHRNKDHGRQLLRLGIVAARAAGAELFIAASQEARPIGALLRRIGFKKSEELYMLRLEPSDE